MFKTESIEIEIPKGKHLHSWRSKLQNFDIISGDKIYVHWNILKSTTHRNRFICVICDDCNIEFERRIRDLKESEYHLCHSCRCKGDRNPSYGKPMNSAFREGRDKLFRDKGNPFTWIQTIDKIKNSINFKNKGLKIRGIKRSNETKKRMSDSMKLAYKNGRKLPRSEWSNIEVKKYKNIEYQGTYELKFLMFIESIGKLDIIERGPIIQYTHEGNYHNYFSDFRIKNTNIVFEIKSDYYWLKNLDVNCSKKKAAELQYDYYLILNNNFKNIENIFVNI